MRSLSASELLNIWEWGRTQPTWSRALKLLATACPETPTERLTQLSIGQRDALLMTLRERTFGSQLVSQATCPGCGEGLELNFSVADVRVASPQAEPTEKIALNVAQYELSFRLPNSLDLIAIADYKAVALYKLAKERMIMAHLGSSDVSYLATDITVLNEEHSSSL